MTPSQLYTGVDKDRSRTYRGNRFRNIHLLRDNQLALLYRALLTNILQLVAQQFLRVYQGDESVFDSQENVSAVFNILREVACGLDIEPLTTLVSVSSSQIGDRAATDGTGGFGSRLTYSMST